MDCGKSRGCLCRILCTVHKFYPRSKPSRAFIHQALEAPSAREVVATLLFSKNKVSTFFGEKTDLEV